MFDQLLILLQGPFILVSAVRKPRHLFVLQLLQSLFELFGNKAQQVRNRLLKKLARIQSKIDQGKYIKAIDKLERFQARILDLAEQAKIAQDDADEDGSTTQQAIAESIVDGLNAPPEDDEEG